ncbi:hypothetical protein CQA53_00500 [Helicobacter didelphidarum]|uniref:Transmembrane protein n=1 Tax=Helicobacter didelphidarum TaxID=2040648 RepID=A0A3D8ISE0_9HELI|nr:hypothetical protein [Helicobacter didelphidarum]RDU67534.1 hypothetical protein CQA53_00500 [Helicobacter didelphidarum]
MKKSIYIFFLVSFLGFQSAYTTGLTQKQLDYYFMIFIEKFPILKFSGFFNNPNNPKTGIHISNCKTNLCDVSYNDYTNFKQNFAPVPECKSANKLLIIDSQHGKIGSALIRIQEDKIHIYGTIEFECESYKIANNLRKVQMQQTQEISPNYELTLKDSVFQAHFNYPINLDCLGRKKFSESQICVEPFLSDTYSFGQFFIFLATQEPQSFHVPDQIYKDYKTMQHDIAVCETSKRHRECIYAVLGKFETQVKNNLIIDDTPNQESMHYRLLH